MITDIAGQGLPGHWIEVVRLSSSRNRFVAGTRRVVMLALVVSLAACATRPMPLPGLPDRVELSGVPFYRGQAHASAPMALAALITQQGVTMTPGLIEPSLDTAHGPQALERSIGRAANGYGLVAYPLNGELRGLLAQVAAGNPVLVRYADGTLLWGEQRYALLVGYDRFKQRVLLRSGMERRKVMDVSGFTSAWASAGHWAMLVQPPTQLPADVDRQRWQAAAQQLRDAGQEPAAAAALRALQGH